MLIRIFLDFYELFMTFKMLSLYPGAVKTELITSLKNKVVEKATEMSAKVTYLLQWFF